MKYFVFEYAEGDDKIKGISVSTFDEAEKPNARELALASFYGKVSTAYKSDLYTSDLVFVTDEYGNRDDRLTEKIIKSVASSEAETVSETEEVTE